MQSQGSGIQQIVTKNCILKEKEKIEAARRQHKLEIK